MTTPLPRELFAVTKDLTYFNHAAVGVLPQPTLRALEGFLKAHAAEGVLGTALYERKMGEYRARIARFIGSQPDEIAVLRTTGDGANAIAAGFPWGAGDELILPDNEFGANAQPWLRLRRHGVHVRFVQSRLERLTPDVLRKHMSAQTKIVTVSWVSFEDGYRHDLAGLAEVAHAGGALFCVDAIQGLGVFPLDVRACGVDALYSGGGKWLLALQGVSFLYLAAHLIDRFELAAPGWRSVSNIWKFLDYDQPLAPNASRFEGGTPNFIGALSLAESIELLDSAGTSHIAPHVLSLTDRLVEGLHSVNADVASVRSESESSGIVTFNLPGADPIELGAELRRMGIVTTYRDTGIRVAPHGYNTPGEIDALLDAIGAYRKEAQCLH